MFFIDDGVNFFIFFIGYHKVQNSSDECSDRSPKQRKRIQRSKNSFTQNVKNDSEEKASCKQDQNLIGEDSPGVFGD